MCFHLYLLPKKKKKKAKTTQAKIILNPLKESSERSAPLSWQAIA